MKIIKYDKKYEKDFIELNIAWVEKYFVMEQEDREILSHVDEYLQKGGMIFFAIEDERVLATCMVIPFGNNIWEICKLAANEQYQSHGAGYPPDREPRYRRASCYRKR